MFTAETEDPEYKILIKVVEKYGTRIPELVDRVKGAHQANPDNAAVILTTAHRSKGLEFKQVELGEDFPDLLDDEEDPSEQEIHLYYVALTRAEQAIKMNGSLADWLSHIGHPVHKIVEMQKRMLAPSAEPAQEVQDEELGCSLRA